MECSIRCRERRGARGVGGARLDRVRQRCVWTTGGPAAAWCWAGGSTTCPSQTRARSPRPASPPRRLPIQCSLGRLSCRNSLSPALCSVPGRPSRDVRIWLMINIHGGPCHVSAALRRCPPPARCSVHQAWAAAALCCVARSGPVCCGAASRQAVLAG